MRTIELSNYGDASKLHLVDRPTPEPASGGVLVRVAATSLNPIDPTRASGVLRQAFPLEFPFVPGGDFSGVVAAVGEGVAGVGVGDAVWGYSDAGGAYAEYIAVEAGRIAPRPADLSDVEAAALALVGQTGMQAVDEAGLVAGRTLLVTGAGGAVGGVAVRYAALLGVNVVAQAGPSEKDRLLAAGAATVIDRDTPLDTLDREADAVVDLVGGNVQTAAFATLRRGGTLVALNQPPSAEKAAERGVRALFKSTDTSTRSLDAVRALVDAGKLAPVAITQFSLADVAQAWRARADGSLKGKAVFTI